MHTCTFAPYNLKFFKIRCAKRRYTRAAGERLQLNNMRALNIATVRTSVTILLNSGYPLFGEHEMSERICRERAVIEVAEYTLQLPRKRPETHGIS